MIGFQMSEPSGTGSNIITITLKDVYIELMKIKESVLEIKGTTNKIPDHEDRIRALEKWRYGLPVSLALAFLSAVVGLLEVLNNH
jgi:hypothetical protein